MSVAQRDLLEEKERTRKGIIKLDSMTRKVQARRVLQPLCTDMKVRLQLQVVKKTFRVMTKRKWEGRREGFKVSTTKEEAQGPGRPSTRGRFSESWKRLSSRHGSTKRSGLASQQAVRLVFDGGSLGPMGLMAPDGRVCRERSASGGLPERGRKPSRRLIPSPDSSISPQSCYYPVASRTRLSSITGIEENH
ncbi:hypothetical protein F2P79_006621 [Pimephales promelas]|nr:hypothetical protein F2P79_006621 [Pimephales promelas]